MVQCIISVRKKSREEKKNSRNNDDNSHVQYENGKFSTFYYKNLHRKSYGHLISFLIKNFISEISLD